MLVENYIFDTKTGKVLEDYSHNVLYKGFKIVETEKLSVFDYMGLITKDRFISIEVRKYNSSEQTFVEGYKLLFNQNTKHLSATKIHNMAEKTIDSNPFVLLTWAKALGISEKTLKKLSEYIDTYINKNLVIER